MYVRFGEGDTPYLQGSTVPTLRNGTTTYFVVNGECQCKDFPKAPSNWCKHRISAGIAKRAYALAKTKLEAATTPQNGHTEPQAVTEQPQGHPLTRGGFLKIR